MRAAPTIDAVAARVRAVRRRLRRRRFRAYGIGAAKTGTTSLAAMFETRHLAAHEPEVKELLRIAPIVDAAGSDGLAALLRARDRRIHLEMEVSARRRATSAAATSPRRAWTPAYTR